jgi:hypothetical protein
MGLLDPIPGVTPGYFVSPGTDYATYLNAALQIIDAHDHSTGHGAPLAAASLVGLLNTSTATVDVTTGSALIGTAITAARSDHQHHIASAGASADGVVSQTTQTFAGVKTFAAGIVAVGINASSQRIQNVADPVSAQDALTLNYFNNHGAYTIGTPVSSNANGLSISGTTLAAALATVGTPGIVQIGSGLTVAAGVISATGSSGPATPAALGSTLLTVTDQVPTDPVVPNRDSSGTLQAQGNAATGGVGVAVDNVNSFASGRLLSIRNAGVEKAYFDYQGNLSTGTVWASNYFSTLSGTVTLFAASGQPVALTGRTTPGSGNAGVQINSSSTLTAGDYIVQFSNGGGIKAYLDYAGALVSSQVRATNILGPALTLTGAQTAAAANPDVVTNTVVTRTSGRLFSVQNNSSEKFYIDYQGNAYANGTLLGQATPAATILANGTVILQSIPDSAAHPLCATVTSGVWQFGNRQLAQVADPTHAQDAATQNWVSLNYLLNTTPAGTANLGLVETATAPDSAGTPPVMTITSSVWSANSVRIGSVADPVNTQDAVTLHYFNTHTANTIGSPVAAPVANALQLSGTTLSAAYAGLSSPGVVSVGSGLSITSAGILSASGVAATAATPSTGGVVLLTVTDYTAGVTTPVIPNRNAAGSMFVRGSMPNGAAAVGTIIDTSATYSTAGARLLSVRNNTSEQAYFDLNGNLFTNQVESVLNGNQLILKANLSGSGEGSVGVVVDTTGSFFSSDNILQVRNNSSPVLNVQFDGSIQCTNNGAGGATLSVDNLAAYTGGVLKVNNSVLAVPNGCITSALGTVTVTNGGTVTPANANYNTLIVTFSTGVGGFTMAAPSSSTATYTGQVLNVIFKNTGSVSCLITFNSIYKVYNASSIFPPNGENQTIMFVFDGTHWIEMGIGPSTVPN